MKKFKVSVVTGTRAEYGLLRPLLFRLKGSEEIEFKLMVTGSHLSGRFGTTKDEIIRDVQILYARCDALLRNQLLLDQAIYL